MLREIAQEANVARGQENAACTPCSANTSRADALGRDLRGLELDHLAQAPARLGRLGWKADPSRKYGTAQVCRERVQLPDEWALSKGELRFSDGSCVYRTAEKTHRGWKERLTCEWRRHCGDERGIGHTHRQRGLPSRIVYAQWHFRCWACREK